MALIKCPGCGNSVSDQALSCPKCNYNIREHLNHETTTCPECGVRIDKDTKTCPECGCPIRNTNTSRSVIIKTPLSASTYSSGWLGKLTARHARIVSRGDIVWQGQLGETAVFYIDTPRSVTINLGSWAAYTTEIVWPGKQYEMVLAPDFHLKPTYMLKEVELDQ